MSSFGLRFLVLIFVSLLCVFLVFYATWFLYFWKWKGGDFSSSLFWLFYLKDWRFFIEFSLVPMLLSYGLGFGGVFFYWLKNERDFLKFERLKERIEKHKRSLNALRNEESELRGSISSLREEEKSLSESLSALKRERERLYREIEELEGKVKRLDELIEEAVNEGRERGYMSVMTELRSLRAQKSALVDLFNRENELREVFKKVTGKTLLQFLNEVKKQIRETQS